MVFNEDWLHWPSDVVGEYDSGICDLHIELCKKPTRCYWWEEWSVLEASEVAGQDWLLGQYIPICAVGYLANGVYE